MDGAGLVLGGRKEGRGDRAGSRGGERFRLRVLCRVTAGSEGDALRPIMWPGMVGDLSAELEVVPYFPIRRPSSPKQA